MGAMVDRAAPFALQDAQAKNASSLTNAQLVSQASELNANLVTNVSTLNAQLQTAVSQSNQAEANRIKITIGELEIQASATNAEILARIESLNAQLGTAVSQGNQTEANRIQIALAELETQGSIAQAQIDADINKLNAELETAVAQGNQAEANRIQMAIADLEARTGISNAQIDADINKLNAELETAVAQGNQQEANRIKVALAELTLQADSVNAELEANINAQNAALRTDASIFNADQVNNALAINAGIGSEIAQSNADRLTNISMFNAEQQNNIIRDVLAMNTALNEQYMKGLQALDLADIQGKYQVLISKNQSAAQLFDTMMTGIAQIMANDKILPSAVAGHVAVLQKTLDAGLDLLEQISNTTIGGTPPADDGGKSVDPDPGSPPPDHTIPPGEGPSGPIIQGGQVQVANQVPANTLTTAELDAAGVDYNPAGPIPQTAYQAGLANAPEDATIPVAAGNMPHPPANVGQGPMHGTNVDIVEGFPEYGQKPLDLSDPSLPDGSRVGSEDR